MALSWSIGVFLALLAAPTEPAADPNQLPWMRSQLGSLLITPFPAAPFPHDSRTDGYTNRAGQLFPKDPHYTDSSVAVFIPSSYEPGETVDLVVHFHGHRNIVANVLRQFELPAQLVQSGRNAILVVPQGPKNAPDSAAGKMETDGGLRRLLDEVLERLHADGKTKSTRLGNVVITAHSGGYRATAFVLEKGGVTDHIHDVILFDATYGGLESFAAFAAQPGRRLISIFTEHLASENFQLLRLLQEKNIPARAFLETDWTDADLQGRGVILIHTRRIEHNDVVSKHGFFAAFVRTTELAGAPTSNPPRSTTVPDRRD